MSSDNRLLLAKGITLLYRESHVTDKEANSADLVRTVLEKVKPPEVQIALSGMENDVIAGLKDTAIWMCTQVGVGPIDKDDLLQRVKINCGLDETLYDAIRQGVDKTMDEPSLKRTILNIRQQINEYFREQEVVALVNKAAGEMKFRREKIPDLREFIKNLYQAIEPYQLESKRKDPAMVGSVDLGDTSNLNEIFTQVEQTNNEGRIFRTGWQGLNDFLQGGFRRGETWVHSALQHNFKTGLNLSLFMQLALYNVPVIEVPNKKPLLLRISTEDSLASNLQFMYQKLFFDETGQMPDIKKIKPAEMTEYVHSRMKKNGWHVRMVRVNPSLWTYRDIQNKILELEAEGFEVQATFIDYLTMIQTTGCGNGVAGSDYQDMLQRLRNFFSARNILFVTPWQCSTEATMLKREGRTNFVQQLSGGGYYKGCKSLGQEPDGEIFHNIETVNGISYLALQRGKHRLPTVIPDSRKYFALPFPSEGPIPDDLEKAPIGVRKIGGGVIGGGEETPFFEFNN